MLTQQSFFSPSRLRSTHTLPLPETFNSDIAHIPSRPDPGPNEREQLDNLLMLALTDHQVLDQLLTHNDPSLLDARGLSKETRDLVARCQGRSLRDLARGIMTASGR